MTVTGSTAMTRWRRGQRARWARALDGPRHRGESRAHAAGVIEELADASGEAPALLSDGESLTFGGARPAGAARYARWALDQGLGTGRRRRSADAEPSEYMAIWLGITRVGGVVALINTNLTGPSLAQCRQHGGARAPHRRRGA